MSQPLWTLEEIIAATGARAQGRHKGPVTGISIDTRTIEPGDLFVALQDQRDGHDFVPQAFERGAAAALVATDYQHANKADLVLRVDNPLRALGNMAMAARNRLNDRARVVAVTGSAGKTTAKEMLRAMFARSGRVHASEKSYNNHWGVPLTLARMPRETDFAVIEIGMNHADEIRPLSRLARPHVALITSVLPVHLENFPDIEAIARAKAEIFEGLFPGACAVLPRDSEHFDLLAGCAARAIGLSLNEAMQKGAIVSFGLDEKADCRLLGDHLRLSRARSRGKFVAAGSEMSFELALAGRHNAMNAMGCIAAWLAATCFREFQAQKAGECPGFDGALAGLAGLEMQPVGRGQVIELGDEHDGILTLVDESYNANPASMVAAFENLSLFPADRRKLAVLGDMLELGEQADRLHAGLAREIGRTGIDLVFACGPHMQALYEALEPEKRGACAANAQELRDKLFSALQKGDVIMVKGSNGSNMGLLVDALKNDRPPFGQGDNN